MTRLAPSLTNTYTTVYLLLDSDKYVYAWVIGSSDFPPETALDSAHLVAESNQPGYNVGVLCVPREDLGTDQWSFHGHPVTVAWTTEEPTNRVRSYFAVEDICPTEGATDKNFLWD